MSITTCKTCFQDTHWSWTEAFDKFGFYDGDGLVMTEHVAQALRKKRYTVTTEPWGCHNVVVTSIVSKKGRALIPARSNLGYDDPLDYLPKRIIKLLDDAFPEDGKVQP